MSLKEPKTIRVLIAKPGLDGHDRGAKVVAMALKNAGMEVIYTGLRQSNDSILQTAIQEGVDIIGLSILAGTHMPICKELLEMARQQGIDVKVVVGGSVSSNDVEPLKKMGVAEVFRTNVKFTEIVEKLEKIARHYHKDNHRV